MGTCLYIYSQGEKQEGEWEKEEWGMGASELQVRITSSPGSVDGVWLRVNISSYSSRLPQAAFFLTALLCDGPASAGGSTLTLFRSLSILINGSVYIISAKINRPFNSLLCIALLL
jgi:hypothetical protein